MIGFYLVKASQEQMHSILATETLKNEMLLQSFKEVKLSLLKIQPFESRMRSLPKEKSSRQNSWF